MTSPIDRTNDGPIYKSDLRSASISMLKAEYDREYEKEAVRRPADNLMLMSMGELKEVLDHSFSAYTAVFGEKIHPQELKAIIIEECFLMYEKRVLELRERKT